MERDYIGYSLDFVLEKLSGKRVEIIYNTQKKESDKLYVTNITFEKDVYIVTVSYFKIEVQ